MNAYEITFTVDGMRTKEVVYAYSSIDAQKILKLRYYGASIMIFGTRNL